MQNSIRILYPLIYEVRIKCSRTRLGKVSAARAWERATSKKFTSKEMMFVCVCIDWDATVWHWLASNKKSNVRAGISLSIINCYGLCLSVCPSVCCVCPIFHMPAWACRLLTTSAVIFVSAFHFLLFSFPVSLWIFEQPWPWPWHSQPTIHHIRVCSSPQPPDRSQQTRPLHFQFQFWLRLHL